MRLDMVAHPEKRSHQAHSPLRLKRSAPISFQTPSHLVPTSAPGCSWNCYPMRKLRLGGAPTSLLAGFVWLRARLVETTRVRKWCLWDVGGSGTRRLQEDPEPQASLPLTRFHCGLWGSGFDLRVVSSPSPVQGGLTNGRRVPTPGVADFRAGAPGTKWQRGADVREKAGDRSD
ncbi:hypothetical protein AAY473_023180 [Plecturocebus cupreus]